MKSILAAALVLSAAFSANADLKIENAQPGNKRLIVLIASGSDAANAGFIWDIYPPTGVERSEAANQLTFTGANGTYQVTLRAILWEKKTIVTATHAVTIGAPANPPPVPDPVDPPTPTGALYFMVIRPDGPADPTFTRTMADVGWSRLREKGHAVKDFVLSETPRLNVSIPAGTPMPCVLTLRVLPGGTTSEIVRGPVALPTTTEAITKLPEGVQ